MPKIKEKVPSSLRGKPSQRLAGNERPVKGERQEMGMTPQQTVIDVFNDTARRIAKTPTYDFSKHSVSYQVDRYL